VKAEAEAAKPSSTNDCFMVMLSNCTDVARVLMAAAVVPAGVDRRAEAKIADGENR